MFKKIKEQFSLIELVLKNYQFFDIIINLAFSFSNFESRYETKRLINLYI